MAARASADPPDYVGYETKGQLAGRLRRRPYSVILLDEIEKAHKDVQHLFLHPYQILDAKLNSTTISFLLSVGPEGQTIWALVIPL